MKNKKYYVPTKALIRKFLTHTPEAKQLTKTETEYLILYMQGNSSDAIAEKLNITKSYKNGLIRQSIMQKFNVDKLMLAAFHVLENGKTVFA